MGLMNEEAIEEHLAKLEVEWGVLAGTTLNRVYKFDDFKQALKFTNDVGKLAEKQNHHPDISLTWGKVEISLSTHNEGGLTEKDFELAKLIEKIK